MSRRRQAIKRRVSIDAKFNSPLVARLVSTVMVSGKKTTAQRIVYGAFDRLIEKLPAVSPVEIRQRAVDNAKPRIETKPRRVGGATYQVPTEVREERRLALALRWLIIAARERKEKTMRDRIANELMDAANGRGGAVTKRENTHKMAEANKAFSHYRW